MRVLILCTGNSARSQMAEGLLRAMAPGIEVHSAGTAPAGRVNPFAVKAMAEVGIDLSAHSPKSVDGYLGQNFDYVITVCGDAEERCPAFHGRVGRRVHLGFPDPAAATGTDDDVLAVFRESRESIALRLRQFFSAAL